MTYNEFKEKQQRELIEFINPFSFFAFNREQMENGLKKLNAGPGNKIAGLGIAGGFILASRMKEYNEFCLKQKREMECWLESGAEHVKEAVFQEFKNHETQLSRNRRGDFKMIAGLVFGSASKPNIKRVADCWAEYWAYCCENDLF